MSWRISRGSTAMRDVGGDLWCPVKSGFAKTLNQGSSNQGSSRSGRIVWGPGEIAVVGDGHAVVGGEEPEHDRGHAGGVERRREGERARSPLDGEVQLGVDDLGAGGVRARRARASPEPHAVGLDLKGAAGALGERPAAAVVHLDEERVIRQIDLEGDPDAIVQHVDLDDIGRRLAGAHAITPDAFERLQGLRRTVYDSADYVEGLTAFRERQPPRFEGR